MTPQEFIDLHWSAPQIEAIDLAIELLAHGKRNTPCFALSAAVNSSMDWVRCWEVCEVNRLYRDQFLAFCMTQNNGNLPSWWDGDGTERNRMYRIAALRDFRAACIAAAKDQS